MLEWSAEYPFCFAFCVASVLAMLFAIPVILAMEKNKPKGDQ